MIVPGVVSVTFRRLAATEVVELTAAAGLSAISWAGDVHVPAGALAVARQVGAATTAAGLTVEGYASYFDAGDSEPAAFDEVLRTAVALGAPTIRVWAGKRAPTDSDAEHRARVVRELVRCAGLAAGEGIRVAVEFHVHTLTKTLDSAVKLFAEAGQENLVPYWQPRELPEVEECLTEVRALLPSVAAAHVFSWGADGYDERLPLDARPDLWQPVLAQLAADGETRHALLEFVVDDDPAVFRRDAATLLGWLG
ncbi:MULTISPECIES: TIM barrel protein [unclassified Crossiella]|uniref:sugar phosphate isomerase/epimerase family protein n=1 Tax=unclassified Crossiella TaxID=2620835 RepID=UPI0020003838|nr:MULTISPECIES: TIM barrel protein [unclassified Crossiella]MCK2236370.1 sugar phosphate isomerase/epimerase [Crossiella sp. S99.2]MCK2250037.1 sugar phosphate isomerase/epimerase [Crossiella sp. S99.1]